MDLLTRERGGEGSSSWNYHPVELLVRPCGLDSSLARRIATNLSLYHQVALVRHGPSYLARPAQQTGIGAARSDGVWAVAGANGQDCLYSHDGHFDLLQQRTLLVDVDFAVVEGILVGRAPTILELHSDGSGIESLPAQVRENLVACVGPLRPVQIPSGGIPWFRPQDEDGLLDLCLDVVGKMVRKRPLWGILLSTGRADRPEVASQLGILSEHCDRCFIERPSDPSWEARGWSSLENAHPTLGPLGLILSCQELDIGAALVILDETEDSKQTDLMERLIAGRDPFRTATVFRELNTHLPAPFPGIWEPKSRIRILQGRAAGVACPQRILTHSRIQLLDRTDSNAD